MTVDEFRKGVEDLAEKLLAPYLDRLKGAKRSFKGKVINDPVWQTVTLHPFEILILDSPLLQRLRGIRQLGVAHWTYPSAHHSRLEHSIGAVHNVQRLLDALVRSSPPAERLVPEWENLLRLAALCHDVGHGFMSHVSENAIDALGIAVDLKLALADGFGIEHCTLAEAASYFLLASPAFKALATEAQRRTGHRLPLSYQEDLPKLILGMPVHERFPLIQELISGPFDADKLDYMSRDAQMSGIPSVTDIPRLVSKVRLLEVPAEQLPPRISKRVLGKHPTYYLQGIATSGARTIDELMIGRTLLYDKIYRHQKVRATEALVLGILTAIAEDAGDALPLLPLRLRDHEILHLTEESLRRKTGLDVRPRRLDAARDLSRRLRDRRLFVAAYAFSHYLPSDPFKDNPEQKVGLGRLRSLVEQPEGRKDLAEKIVKELRSIRATVTEPIAADIPDDSLPFYVALDPPSPPSRTSEIGKALLVTTREELVAFRDDVGEAAPWSNAYLLTRDLGFVFCADELGPAVYLATELVLRRDLKVRTPDSVFDYSKVSRDAVNGLREQLAAKNFYSGALVSLRPEPKRLSMADVAGRLEAITRKLAAFYGLTPEGERRARTAINPGVVRVWLRQFKSDRWVEAAMDLLGTMQVIGPDAVTPAVEAFMTTYPEFKGATGCPLGRPGESSGVVSYYVGDLAARYELSQADLGAALMRRDGRPILFVDDFIGRGAQSSTILGQWLGQEVSGALLERHVDPLAPDLQAELKARQLGFVFLAGDPEGAKALKEAAEALGLQAVTDVFLPTTALPRAFDARFAPPGSPSLSQEFQQICRRIGEQLLTDYHGKQREAGWVKDRSLGFGNDALLIAFPYNCPTQALTLLWCEGTVDGSEWLPLLPRRMKL